MSDRPRGSIPVSALRVDRAEIGAATAVIDDDLLTFVVRVGHEDRPMRLRFVAIDSAQLHGDEVVLMLRDGRRVSLVSTEAAALRDEIVKRCRTLPELTRTLRAYGSRRGRRSARETEAVEQQRFFAGLMDARRNTSKDASAKSAVAAFDAQSLARALDETVRQFARDRHGENAPARRALEAELIDLSEPLHAALESLAQAATDVESEPEDLRVWRAWSIQLRTVFEIADRVWMTLDVALDAAPFSQ